MVRVRRFEALRAFEGLKPSATAFKALRAFEGLKPPAAAFEALRAFENGCTVIRLPRSNFRATILKGRMAGANGQEV